MFQSKRICAVCSPILLVVIMACAHSIASEEEEKAVSPKSAKKTAGSDDAVLRLKLLRSRPKTRPSAVRIIPGKRVYSIDGNGTRLQSIVRTVMEAARTRLVVSPSVPEIRYDFDYSVRRGSGPIHKPLIDAICEDSGVQIAETESVRDVWVARVGARKPAESTRERGRNGDKDGFLWFNSMPLSEILRSIENGCDVLIDDETKLSGAYDFSYRPRDGFPEAQKQLTDQLGLELRLENRKTRIIEITLPPPHGADLESRKANDSGGG